MAIDTPHIVSPIAVFDLDGTLADTAGDLVGTLNVILEREGLAALPVAQARDMIGAGARALIERGFEAAGKELAPSRLDELFRQFMVHYGQNICVRTKLYPGVEAALDRLEEAGFILAVCTNKVEEHSVKLLDALGIGHRFAANCGRDTFPYFKPDPRHLTLTIERAGGDPGRAVMVGDSRTDIVTAKNAGIPVVAVPFGYTDVPVRELGPDLVIDHFDGLFAAVRAVLRPMAA
ncbi:phosphoglycolate phosphatase [Microvirga terrae]|uniref:Phosphoglycolate phosphatase n=1 Tax=Microvirga terrae TaxID=2740529 RepID=A0ABY5RPA1_9HYPH|nr:MULTISPECIES: HAD family hydrolase [Microvirga]MBQ0824299.1 phosphoglycolate phosphatase [Microvirga sp. HBU67558]UVF18186.1 phosphoglycolate phosphatase [Microvirga terrae]